MDLQMPGVGGIEATCHILRSSPQMSVLVLSMFEDDDSIFAALRAGARGYLLKEALKAEILRAIRAVATGRPSSAPSSRNEAGAGKPTASPSQQRAAHRRPRIELMPFRWPAR